MVARTSAKEDLAAEAWRPLARFFFDTVRHRQKVMSSEGLTPNDVRALMALDPSEGRTMSDLADAWSCDASNATFITQANAMLASLKSYQGSFTQEVWLRTVDKSNNYTQDFMGRIPEPTVLAFLGIGCLVAAFFMRRPAPGAATKRLS